MANKLDMTLDALIKTSRSKPAAAAGAKKAGGAKPGGGKAGGGAAGSKQLKKPQQKAQQKGKQQQQQQQQGKKPQQKPGIKAGAGGKQIKASLQVKGGISKASGGKAQQRPGVQQRGGGRQAPDVRVVPRPGVARPAQQHPRGGALRHGGGYMQPVAGGHYMAAAPMMMAPQMMAGPAGSQQRAGPSDRDLFDGTLVSSNTSSKLLVSNLDHKVTDEDIRELFGTVGPIKESGVHYDRNGRSAGTAYVVFERRSDALAAFNRYNNVALDNKKMAIEVVEQAVPRGTFKTLASGINVSRAQAAAAAAGIRGRGLPHDYMQE